MSAFLNHESATFLAQAGVSIERTIILAERLINNSEVGSCKLAPCPGPFFVRQIDDSHGGPELFQRVRIAAFEVENSSEIIEPGHLLLQIAGLPRNCQSGSKVLQGRIVVSGVRVSKAHNSEGRAFTGQITQQMKPRSRALSLSNRRRIITCAQIDPAKFHQRTRLIAGARRFRIDQCLEGGTGIPGSARFFQSLCIGESTCRGGGAGKRQQQKHHDRARAHLPTP